MSKKLCSATIATALAAGLVALSIFGCWQDYQSNKSKMLGGNPTSELSILFG